jgi:hypothetical protein
MSDHDAAAPTDPTAPTSMATDDTTTTTTTAAAVALVDASVVASADAVVADDNNASNNNNSNSNSNNNTEVSTSSAAAAPTVAPTSSAAAPARNLSSLEEKQRLAALVNGLSMAALGGVAEILMRRVPDLKEHAGLEIRLDLETLDVDTLREIDAFVRADSSARAASSFGAAPLFVPPMAAATVAANSLGAPALLPPSSAAAAAAAAAASSGASGDPVAKKARTLSPGGVAKANAKKESQAQKKAEQAAAKAAQKVDVVNGCERLLRVTGRPLSCLELLIAGTDQGLFHVTAHKDPLKFVEDTLKGEVKGAARVFSQAQVGKFGLREWALSEDERRTFADQRLYALVQAPPCANPATRDQAQLFKAKFVHDEMFKHPAHFMFAVPVDPVALNIPDYPTIITNPMDNGTIKKRLDDGYYKTLDEYKADVELVWSNATRYNPATHEVHECALAIRAQWHGLLDKYMNAVYAPQVPELPPAGSLPPPPVSAVAPPPPTAFVPPPMAFTVPPPFGAPPPSFGAPPPSFGAPPPSFSAPPVFQQPYAAATPAAFNAPPPFSAPLSALQQPPQFQSFPQFSAQPTPQPVFQSQPQFAATQPEFVPTLVQPQQPPQQQQSPPQQQQQQQQWPVVQQQQQQQQWAAPPVEQQAVMAQSPPPPPQQQQQQQQPAEQQQQPQHYEATGMDTDINVPQPPQ